jgi:hypothetical protein
MQNPFGAWNRRFPPFWSYRMRVRPAHRWEGGHISRNRDEVDDQRGEGVWLRQGVGGQVKGFKIVWVAPASNASSCSLLGLKFVRMMATSVWKKTCFQGDRIGRIFAYWVIVFFEQFFFYSHFDHFFLKRGQTVIVDVWFKQASIAQRHIK